MRARFTLLAALGAALGSAHPMGNFSVSHYARFEAAGGGVRLMYALDLAEIPTFELLRDWRLDAASPRAELEARARRQAEEWAANLTLRVDGAQVAPVVESSELVVAEGAGALPVVRITARLRVPGAPGRVEYEDRNYPDRAGWKEIVVTAGGGALLRTTSHRPEDRSQALAAYPADPSITPPQDLRAVFEWAPAAPASAPAAAEKPPVVVPVKQPEPPMAEVRPAAQASAGGAAPAGTVTKGDYLSTLLRRGDLGPGVILLGLCAAFGLGALHALSPGHGKTIVAAYLVGARGTFRHAALLGATFTFTHTVSVFLLGLATLFLSAYVVPEKVYPVLGAISGLSIVAIGATLFRKRLRNLLAQHSHHHHHHHHHDHEHHHGHEHHHHHPVPEEVTMAGLIALGASGGLVPCPSALVLLLSSIALGRTGVGLLLLTSFSLGLALVLMVIGCLVLYAKHLLPEPAATARSPFFRLAPVLSAALITSIGALMTAVSLGWVKPMLF